MQPALDLVHGPERLVDAVRSRTWCAPLREIPRPVKMSSIFPTPKTGQRCAASRSSSVSPPRRHREVAAVRRALEVVARRAHEGARDHAADAVLRGRRSRSRCGRSGTSSSGGMTSSWAATWNTLSPRGVEDRLAPCAGAPRPAPSGSPVPEAALLPRTLRPMRSSKGRIDLGREAVRSRSGTASRSRGPSSPSGRWRCPCRALCSAILPNAPSGRGLRAPSKVGVQVAEPERAQVRDAHRRARPARARGCRCPASPKRGRVGRLPDPEAVAHRRRWRGGSGRISAARAMPDRGDARRPRGVANQRVCPDDGTTSSGASRSASFP